MEAQRYLKGSINKIVVVLQGESESVEAMKYAAGLSKLCGASILLVYPMELSAPTPMALPSHGAWGTASLGVWEEVEREARTIVDDAKKTMSSLGMHADVKIIEFAGSVGRSIGELSECDMVVVSETKARGLQRLLEKDLAVDVVKNAKCPVFVVHAPGRSTGKEGSRR
jgi:nucleotide-binding universal stress UspA family protein